MTKFKLYLITRLDEIKEVSCAISLISALGVFFTFFILVMEKVLPLYTTHLILSSIFLIVIPGLLSILLPTKKDVALILGLNEVLNNKEAKKLPGNVLKLANDLLENAQNKVKKKA